MSAGNGTAKHNGMNQKNQYFSLLYRIIACLEGLQSCLPDFVPTAASVSSPGTSLVAAGQVWATPTCCRIPRITFARLLHGVPWFQATRKSFGSRSLQGDGLQTKASLCHTGGCMCWQG